ncbi:DUF167 family protein [Tepidamorphus gemmatus]|uniref:DUF167 family protein n=1 Tax=Tepidamorphus gemmatus TaxID=747076 RepID=UPI001FDFB7EB|nr:DUF167 family protein [Tepidamorphus gemmatus]
MRLTPKGGRDAIEGPRPVSDGSWVLAARVRAVPEGGQANAALEVLLARALGVARATVAVACGHKARLKRVHVAGDPALLAERAARIGGNSGRENGR